MGFWETALAAALGTVIATAALFLIAAFGRLLWMRSTPEGRFHARVTDRMNEVYADLENEQTGAEGRAPATPPPGTY
jgi:type IV secretory pathway TrbD component